MSFSLYLRSQPKYRKQSRQKHIWGLRPEKEAPMPPESEEEPTPASSMAADFKKGKGGNTVRDKYGEDYYRRIGKIGGQALKERRGSDYYRSIVQKGAQGKAGK